MIGDDKTEPEAADAATREAPAAEGAPSEADRAAAAAPGDPPAPPKPRSSLLTRALAAIGLVLAGGLGALSFSDMLPPQVAALLGVAPAGGGAQVAALDDRVARLSTAAQSAGAAAEAAQVRALALDGRLDELAAALAALSARVDEGGGAGGGDPALAGRIGEIETALTDRLAALEQTVAGLRAEAEGLSARVEEAAATAQAGSLEAYDARIAALEQGQQEELAWRDLAEKQAEAARRYTSVSAAFNQIDRAMTLGDPFPEALAQLVAAAGQDAPAAVAAVADAGAPTREALKASFPEAAYAAIEAALVGEAEQSDQALAGVVARIQARVTGLPGEAVAGDSAPAVLSRARVALLDGNIEAALAAVEALPPAAQAAMADWTTGARRRSEADAALDAWRAELAGSL